MHAGESGQANSSNLNLLCDKRGIHMNPPCDYGGIDANDQLSHPLPPQGQGNVANPW